jgi:hypothetical protein
MTDPRKLADENRMRLAEWAAAGNNQPPVDLDPMLIWPQEGFQQCEDCAWDICWQSSRCRQGLTLEEK